jgi:hypothetical protein
MVSVGSQWNITQETNVFIIRDVIYSHDIRDSRFAFFANVNKDYGKPVSSDGTGINVLCKFPIFSFQEENGVLVIRDTFNPGDHRYAFYPGSGNINFGTPKTKIVSTQGTTALKGHRWLIVVENGVLIFRDTLTPGDHRYAFFAGNYIDM